MLETLVSAGSKILVSTALKTGALKTTIDIVICKEGQMLSLGSGGSSSRYGEYQPGIEARGIIYRGR